MEKMPKPAKKPARKRVDIERPRNGGTWSEARFLSFVKSALRGARWGPKYTSIQNAFVEHGINPETGRKCKLCRCASCLKLFPQGQLKADHIVPCVGPEGFQDWDEFIRRLYVEAEGFQALCSACHDSKTSKERAGRAFEKAFSESNANVDASAPTQNDDN